MRSAFTTDRDTAKRFLLTHQRLLPARGEGSALLLLVRIGVIIRRWEIIDLAVGVLARFLPKIFGALRGRDVSLGRLVHILLQEGGEPEGFPALGTLPLCPATSP